MDGLFQHHFQQYFNYIVAVSFISGGNRRTRRKPPTCRKSLTLLNEKETKVDITNSISCLFIEVGKRSSALVSANTTNIVLQCIVREAEDTITNDEVLLLSHQVLAKLSSKGMLLLLYEV